jgi:hypothetical protein
MINFIQLNQNITKWEENIITDAIWERICELLVENDYMKTANYVHEISIQYNTDKRNILKSYFHYIIRNKKEVITPEYLKNVETIMHFKGSNIEHVLLYFSSSFMPTKN